MYRHHGCEEEGFTRSCNEDAEFNLSSQLVLGSSFISDSIKEVELN